MAERAFPSRGLGARPGATAALAVAAVALGHAGATAYSEGAPPAHTGGFGEPTCHRCHFDRPVNDPAGSLQLEGLPAAYAPGAPYVLTISIERPGLRKAGFQLAARFAAGPHHGEQAGRLRSLSDRVAVAAAAGSAIEYARQTLVGTAADSPSEARWSIEWTAPTRDRPELVTLHLAANAANDDDSEFGDYIYAVSYRVPPRPTLR